MKLVRIVVCWLLDRQRRVWPRYRLHFDGKKTTQELWRELLGPKDRRP